MTLSSMHSKRELKRKGKLQSLKGNQNSSGSIFRAGGKNPPNSPSSLLSRPRRRPAPRFEGSRPLQSAPLSLRVIDRATLKLASGAPKHHGGRSCAAPAGE
jgi:hypothetical protein